LSFQSSDGGFLGKVIDGRSARNTSPISSKNARCLDAARDFW